MGLLYTVFFSFISAVRKPKRRSTIKMPSGTRGTAETREIEKHAWV